MSEIQQYLRIVRTVMDAMGISAEEAMKKFTIPADIRAKVREKLEEEMQVPIRRVNILTDNSPSRSWYSTWSTSNGYYWNREREYLVDRQQLPSDAIRSIDDSTDKILSRLYDPRPSGPASFDLRGLVMGYVQSGKTANYLALIAKAADLGYKLVIVLAGIHNSLRLQTQRRVNRALGIDPNGAMRPQAGLRWISLTEANIHGDFMPGTVDANILQGNERVVIVCKKIAPVLRRLSNWLEKYPPPETLPVLVIDDEADLASINTRGNRPPIDEETDLNPEDYEDATDVDDILDPSAINYEVRKLVNSFSRACYVAYTATPFANILINHLAIDREVYKDLYPKDFIVSLPMPRGYIGAEKLFGREAFPGEEEDIRGLDGIIKIIPSTDAILVTPTSSDVTTYNPVIPDSLKEAFCDYILATAARMNRAGTAIPSTMLVHTHLRKIVQNKLGKAIQEFVSQTREKWRYENDSILPEFEARWNNNFRPVIVSINKNFDTPFEKIKPHIDEIFHDPVIVITLNSDSEEELDYEKDPFIKAVVVGGNRLSRGLTLEGLTTSYYTRDSDQYDTLMQMGRWFGFREDYVDLTRLYTTEILKEKFEHLATAEEELRHEISRYERERITPLDFGPKIRSHPAMMVTASNKMGSATKIFQNYSGRRIQSQSFRLNDKQWLERNLKSGERLIGELGCPHSSEGDPYYPSWSEISWNVVDSFLESYAFDPSGRQESGAIRKYIKKQVDQGELRKWIIALRSLKIEDKELGREPRLEKCGIQANRISRTLKANSSKAVGALVTPSTKDKPPYGGDEEIGLSLEAIEWARNYAIRYSETGREQDETFSDLLRVKRDKNEGVLLLYPISPYSRPRNKTSFRKKLYENPDEWGTILGICLIFPASDSAATIEYVVGSVNSNSVDDDEN